MIVLNSRARLKESIRFHMHESQKIGKFDINHNKMLSNGKYIHDGHIHCINELRRNGCTIIILECINSTKCFSSIQTDIPDQKYFYDDEEILTDNDLISYCRDILKIDYLIYNPNDYDQKMDDDLIKFVDNIIKKENYIDLLKLSDTDVKLLRANLIIRTHRKLQHLTYIKCYKDGLWVFALKHYMKKYLDNDLIITEPIMIPDTYYPLSSSEKEIPQDVQIFSNYFKTIKSLNDLDRLIKFSEKLGGRLLIYKIIKLKELTNNKKVICVNYKAINDTIYKFHTLF